MADHSIIRESTPEEQCFYCAKHDKLRDLKSLFKKGAEQLNINALEEHSLETPLFVAVNRANDRCAMFLLSKGADPDARSESGWTPLHALAKASPRLEMAKVLIEAGADVNAKTVSGWTPLHLAARRGHAETCSVLLAAGADPNAKAKDGDTPLHWAAERDYAEACSALLDRGADPLAVNSDGKTPIELAREKGHSDVEEAIRPAFHAAMEKLAMKDQLKPALKRSARKHLEL